MSDLKGGALVLTLPLSMNTRNQEISLMLGMCRVLPLKRSLEISDTLTINTGLLQVLDRKENYFFDSFLLSSDT